jgi:hypothetical protein
VEPPVASAGFRDYDFLRTIDQHHPDDHDSRDDYYYYDNNCQ